MSAHQQQRASIEAELRKNKRLLQFVLQTQEMLTQPTVVPPAIFKATVRLPSPLRTRMRLVQTLRPLPSLPASPIQSLLPFRVVGKHRRACCGRAISTWCSTSATMRVCAAIRAARRRISARGTAFRCRRYAIDAYASFHRIDITSLHFTCSNILYLS